MNYRFILTLALTFGVMSSSYSEWGQTGHRVIGEIAEAHLSNTARKQIDLLLEGHSLAFFSFYSDEIKSDSQYDSFKPWHYINFPFDSQYAGEKTSDKGDLAEGIAYCIAQLKNEETPDDKKAFFLKMLIHLIGDLHQPMHIGISSDRGGNGFPVKWFGRKTNLHRVWDTQMIDGFGMSYTELALNRDRWSKSQIRSIQEGSIEDWINDSRTLTKDIYQNAQPDQKLSYAYSYRYMNVLRTQLHKGGLRLAKILNTLFK